MLFSWLKCSVLQTLWLATCVYEAVKFKIISRRSLKNTQLLILKEILENSSNTEFGNKYNFNNINSISEFQNNVPISQYADMRPWVDKIADGKKNVLTNEEVIMFEETSGSAAATKLIPYTPKLQEAFNRALHPWLIDLYLHYPQLWGGPSYWVITPKSNMCKKTSGGIPIGFATDSEYFGHWGKNVIDLLMAVPSCVANIEDIKAWKYATILSLLRQKNLKMISLWNPTFLSVLMSEIIEFSEDLRSDLCTGNCKYSPNIKELQGQSMTRRARVFSEGVNQIKLGNFDIFCKLMWPNLCLISTWTENEARIGALQLANDFPQALLQTKGILSTEGAVSIPIVNSKAPVLAARSAFFEFIEAKDPHKKIILAHQLQVGKKYSVIMTTFGGLFRYPLNDIVKVECFWNKLPCFSFIGKESRIVDLCGEKLNEDHVKSIITILFNTTSGVFMAPERSSTQILPGYNLFISAEKININQVILRDIIERELKKNFHYNWCLENGQLRSLRVVVVQCTMSEFEIYRLDRLQEEGRKISTAKAQVLTNIGNWSEWFASRSI